MSTRHDIDFAVAVDGKTVESSEETRLKTEESIYALSVPVMDADEIRVSLQAGKNPEWRLPNNVVERLASAPEYELRDAKIVKADGETALKLTLENSGNRDGIFRAVAQHATAADTDSARRIPVGANETVTKIVQPSVVTSWLPDAKLSHEIDVNTRTFSIS